jgi:hypothetical protein
MKVAFNVACTSALVATASADLTTGSPADLAKEIIGNSKQCFSQFSADKDGYTQCSKKFCSEQCDGGAKVMKAPCEDMCTSHAFPLFSKFVNLKIMNEHPPARKVDTPLLLQVETPAQKQADEYRAEIKDAAKEQQSALLELEAVQEHMNRLNHKIAARAQQEITSGDAAKGRFEMEKVKELEGIGSEIDKHINNVATFSNIAAKGEKQVEAPPASPVTSFLQMRSVKVHAPEDELAKEMTHDLEMNFNKIAPFGKEDTAKELQDHAAKTQDTLVDAVENAEVAEIKRAVFRALTRLRAATIKEFDTIARLETQAIDAYNDAHHYRAENPLAHLHEDEAPVETDKLKSFH